MKVFDFLELALREERFSDVDAWLESINPDNLEPAETLAALSITFWGKASLTKREAFLQRAETSLCRQLGAERAFRLLEHRR